MPLPSIVGQDSYGVIYSDDPNLWARLSSPGATTTTFGGSSTPKTESLPASVTQSSPTLNAITGTIGKAFDTFLDALAIQGAGKIVGSVYPTGQQSPQQVGAQQQAAQIAAPFNWKPWAIGGGVLLAVLVLPLYVPVLIFGVGAAEARPPRPTVSVGSTAADTTGAADPGGVAVETDPLGARSPEAGSARRARDSRAPRCRRSPVVP